MPQRGWKSEVFRLSLLLGVAAFFGLFLDLFPWFLLGASLAYCLWSIDQLRRLNIWLQRDRSHEDDTPPDAATSGLWGQVFDNLGQRQRESRRVKERLQANIDHLRSSFKSMADGAVMLLPDGTIDWCNEPAQTFLGLRFPEDRGRLLVNLVRAPDFIAYFEKGDYSDRFMMPSPVNQEIQLSISVTVFGESNRLLFARDISRTAQLETMRKEFVANVSHELRTPLTVINGYLEMLADQVEPESPTARALAQMTEQSQRMQSLIHDLMALSKLEALPPARHSDRIAMLPLMHAIKEEIVASAIGEREIVIECDENLFLRGAAKEIQSAFSNLGINAARYTRDGDRIVLRWYADRRNAYFEVEDTGIGIEPQHLPRLTERFYRVDQSRSTETGGTGLGLAIVKHVLLRHKAELRIRSQIGKGSTFTCVFPIALIEKS